MNRGGEDLPYRFDTSPLVGYRMWRLRAGTSGTEGYGLHSLSMVYVWDEFTRAECLRGAAAPWTTVTPHEAPDLPCSCGLYCALADKPVDDWEVQVNGRFHARGSVALTGRIIRCQAGLRAQYAQILSPVVVEGWCGEPECYGDPHVVSQYEDGTGWIRCAEHDPGDLLPSDVWLASVLAELRSRYPNTEFLTWTDL